MTENQISYQIRGSIFSVYNELGPGLLESIYQEALLMELTKQRLIVKREVPVPVYYDGQRLNLNYRLDLLVEEKVIIELKSVEYLMPVHHKQVLTYLKITNLKLAILVNFNVDKITEGIFRKVNKL